MGASIDLYGLALVVAAIALFGWFFWHVAASLLDYGRSFARYLDGSSARRRAALEREARFGPLPLWYRAGQVISIVALVAGLVALLWLKISAQ
ncbi:hypothetical protein [Ensifer soli]|uniref:hypothetical protein n=1 Tax=Ciceribacter sp. sgz301302 TaxID=3342379 RepID=UPI0035B76816